MEGKQQAVYEQTMDIANKIRDGFYGEDDEFDSCAFFDDFEDVYNSIED